MRNLGLTFILMSIAFSACKKAPNNYLDELKQKEIDDRDAYIEAEGITVEPTASGLYYIETDAGTGVQPVAGDVVHVHYQGELLSTQIFDSSWNSSTGEPLKFTLGTGEVIAGWDEAIALMKEGGRAKLIIPSDLAYGAAGKQPTIAPYSTLVFYVQLVDVE